MPRPHIPAKLRRLVINRAGGQFEYCLIHQDDRPETHPIDHVIALKHGGRTMKENLALACVICNGNKGSDLATIDPLNGEIVPLFNPRTKIQRSQFRRVWVFNNQTGGIECVYPSNGFSARRHRH